MEYVFRYWCLDSFSSISTAAIFIRGFQEIVISRFEPTNKNFFLMQVVYLDFSKAALEVAKARAEVNPTKNKSINTETAMPYKRKNKFCKVYIRSLY